MPVIAGGKTKLKIGATYKCIHSRKGTFHMRIDSVDGEWITGVVVDGVASAMMSYNVKREGDGITVRDEHCYFVPLSEEANT